MLTKYAVLGLLLQQRGYGYQLVQRLKERLGPAWQLNPSSVYAALDLLEAEGLVRPQQSAIATNIPAERGARRLVYEITDAGRLVFQEWVSRPAPRQEPIRSELHLKVAFAQPDQVPVLLRTLDYEEEIADGIRRECVEGEEGNMENHWSTLAASLVRAGAKARLESDLRWIERSREALREAAASAEAPAAVGYGSRKDPTATG